MKYRLQRILFALAIISLLMSCNNKLDNLDKNASADRFIADSGYILKKEAIALLLQLKDTNAVDVKPTDFKTTDTLGKYYKTKTGNYIACVLDIIHPDVGWHPVVIEYTADGNIIKNENFYGGTYMCCWDNNYDGFEKHGDYYSIKTCETGSGFCSGNINIFKEIEPQYHDGIPVTAWSTMCGYRGDGAAAIACSLTSKISITSDVVTMHYKLEHLELQEAQDAKDEKYTVIETEFFDIKYIKKETGWVALNSTHFSKIPM